MVRQLERSSHTTDGLFTCYPIGANAHNTTLQNVNVNEGITYSKPVLKCQGGSWFQQTCGHGNWKWVWAPCGKWSCKCCHGRRIREQMIPEIQMALELAKERCQTLKFLTLTACDGYLGGEPTTEGANRRWTSQRTSNDPGGLGEREGPSLHRARVHRGRGYTRGFAVQA